MKLISYYYNLLYFYTLTFFCRSGHWHGDVLIYTFRNGNSKESVRKFWESIVQLCMVRHENISLFMGACVDSPNLAVVTSMRKGPSLYEYIHIKQQTIYLPNKIHIARQIAQVGLDLQFL